MSGATVHADQPKSGWQKPIKSSLLRGTILAGGALLFALSAPAANAATWYYDGFTISLQSTLDYSLGVRTAPVDNEAIGVTTDDGDRNFRTGITENLFQATEQLNIQQGDYGFRGSAQALIDTAYLQHSKNNSPDTFNSYNIGPQGFPSGTVANAGRNYRTLAAFVYGAENFDGGQQRFSWQVGRQTITWGESLFSSDGISGIQAPVNVFYAASEPNPQVQAIYLPTGAASTTYDFGNGITVNGYWQFEYEPDVLPGVGSYFSAADFIGPGGQRLLITPLSEGGLSLYRAPDIRPSNGIDQFGFAAHDTFGNYSVGAYFVRAIPKAPNLYTSAYSPVDYAPGPGNGLKIGQYNEAYSQPVNELGVSATTSYGALNAAGEFVVKQNTPLVSAPAYTLATPANYNDPLYAAGDVANAELNGIYVSSPLPLIPNGITVLSELTLNQVLGITARKAALVPNRTREGGSFEITATPSWFPTSALEIELPVGLNTVFLGKSQYDTTEDAGTSTYDIGLTGVYKQNLTFGVTYQRYAGPVSGQSFLDRDFVSFYIDRTF